MFEESLVESASLLRDGRGRAAVLSVAIEAALVCALVVFPWVHPEVLKFGPARMMVVVPPAVMKPPPPPVRVIRPETTASPTAPQAAAMQGPRISLAPFVGDGQTVDEPALAAGMDLSGGGQSPLPVIRSSGPRIAVGVAATASAAPLNVSTGVMQGRLIEPILPQYPAIARISRSEGTVVLKAVISRTGTIESARVESGPAVLQAAALDAVRRARYRPFLLNGQPTEVETTISIVFRIGS
jgi:periplasmic protein TonB